MRHNAYTAAMSALPHQPSRERGRAHTSLRLQAAHAVFVPSRRSPVKPQLQSRLLLLRARWHLHRHSPLATPLSIWHSSLCLLSYSLVCFATPRSRPGWAICQAARRVDRRSDAPRFNRRMAAAVLRKRRPTLRACRVVHGRLCRAGDRAASAAPSRRHASRHARTAGQSWTRPAPPRPHGAGAAGGFAPVTSRMLPLLCIPRVKDELLVRTIREMAEQVGLCRLPAPANRNHRTAGLPPAAVVHPVSGAGPVRA